MKKIIINSFIILFLAVIAAGCKKQNYPGGEVSAYLPIFDLRGLFKGADLPLSPEVLYGSTSIAGVVISDHSGKNLPAGLLFVQDKRRLNKLRGIAIPIGADAANYVPGDSLIIKIDGGVLKRENGILQITGLTNSSITKVASGVVIPPNRVGSSKILAKPDEYESTLVAIVKAGFDPLAQPGDTYAGDKIINDGFGNIILHTEVAATFANTTDLNFSANYYGIVINNVGTTGTTTPQVRIRTLSDVIQLSSVPEISPVLITGYMADAEGGDGNYEYMQFLATKDINFATTKYSVVVTSNAGGSSPTGVFPTKGWATGIDAAAGTTARTYKLDLTSGTVLKGQFFYVGGSTKLINGSGSTSIATANWIKAYNYSTTSGNGFGLKTSGLFANSGNASGFAIFAGTTVDVNSVPLDVVFIGTGGSIYSADLNLGYKIANNDFYDRIDPITLMPQPFYKMGTNTLNFAYQLPSDQGFWNKLGGVYNVALGKWVQARTQSNIDLSKTSTLDDIEGISYIDVFNSNGVKVRTDTIPPTTLK